MANDRTLAPAGELARKNQVRLPNEDREYRRARDALLVEEIELRRHMERVAALRRALPAGGLVPEDYVFEGSGPDGKPAKVKLSQLFAPGKDTLVTYGFMFPRYPQDDRPGPARGVTARLKRDESPCPSCTAFLDSLDGAAEHVEAAGFNFVVIAEATLDRLTAFARDRQWKGLRLVSSTGNSFKRDYHAETPEGFQMPMITVFHRLPAAGSGIFGVLSCSTSIPTPGRIRATPALSSRCGTSLTSLPRAGHRTGRNSCNTTEAWADPTRNDYEALWI